MLYKIKALKEYTITLHLVWLMMDILGGELTENVRKKEVNNCSVRVAW